MEDILKQIDTALLFLKDGESFLIGDIKMGVNEDGLFVTGWTNYVYLENVTKETALAELNQLKECYFKLLDISVKLKEFQKGKNIEFILAYNYGKGGILLCSEKNGIINWETSLAE